MDRPDLVAKRAEQQRRDAERQRAVQQAAQQAGFERVAESVKDKGKFRENDGTLWCWKDGKMVRAE